VGVYFDRCVFLEFESDAYELKIGVACSYGRSKLSAARVTISLFKLFRFLSLKTNNERGKRLQRR
jgi:hypothetical protein